MTQYANWKKLWNNINSVVLFEERIKNISKQD